MTKPTTPESNRRPGLLRRWVRGVFESQKAMAASPRRAQVVGETMSAIKRVRNLRVAPRRVETFEQAIARKGYSQERLDAQMRQHKHVHLALYAVAAALVVWALHLGLKFNWFFGMGALMAAVSAGVNGYIHGYRAWQIEHRNLIRLQDAIRIPGTYLVL